MQFIPDNLYHVFNQGNNKQNLFLERNDFITFLNLLRHNIIPYSDIIAYCLMPNHFHFMIATDERCNSKIKQGGLIIDPITNGIRKLLSSYSRIYNSKNEKSGSMFRQKTKDKCLSGITETRNALDARDYYFSCFHYIHQNPLKAGLVKKLEEWEYSSYRDYAGLRNGTLINKALAVKYCGYNRSTFIKESYELTDDDIFC
jgi:putative transposase